MRFTTYARMYSLFWKCFFISELLAVQLIQESERVGV